MRPASERPIKEVDPIKQSGRPLCIVVLGMHRSGTSVLAGVLGLLGASLPKKMMPANESNPKGFFEPYDIVELHDEMLSALGSSWADFRRLDPALFNSAAAAPFKARLVAMLRAEYGGAKTFVVKDPRICRFFPFWRDVADAFGAETRALLVIRNPLEVAWSLAQRDGLPQGYGLNLWLRHVLDAEFETRHSPRVFVTYAGFMRDWLHVIEASENEMGIALSDRTPEVQAAVEALIDGDMRHYAVDEETFAHEYRDNPLVLKTYRALETLVARDGDAAAMKALDEVREKFDETIRVRGYRIDADLISVLNKLHSAQGRIAQFEAKANLVGPLQNEISSAQARMDEMEAVLAERAKEISDLNARFRAAQEKSLAEVTALGYQHKVEQERQKSRQRQLEQQVATVAAEAAKAASELAKATSELSLTQSSLSWRLGKPLRLLGEKFPRVIRMIKRIFGL
jgi:hypothetical protein